MRHTIYNVSTDIGKTGLFIYTGNIGISYCAWNVIRISSTAEPINTKLVSKFDFQLRVSTLIFYFLNLKSTVFILLSKF